MNTFEFIAHLRNRDIKLTVDGDQLRLQAPKGALTPPLRDQLAARKLELLAYLQEANQVTKSSQAAIPRASRERPLPLSPNQQRLWSLNQLTPDSPAYNMHLAVRLNGPLKIPALEQSLNALIERHEILRTTFPVSGEAPVQQIALYQVMTLAIEPIPNETQAEQQRQIEQRIASEAGRPYDLERGPLLRLKLLHLSDVEHVLLIGMHHIISDGWSYKVFLQELSCLYEAHRADRTPELAELPVQYADYAAWQQDQLDDVLLDALITYWQKQLAGEVPPLALPTDQPVSVQWSNQAGSRTFSISAPHTTALKNLSQEAGVTLFVTLLTAYNIWLQRHTGQLDMIVCSPVAGRDREETKNLIGYFNNLILLRSRLSESMSFRELLQQTAQTVLGAYEHQELPFQHLGEFPNLARMPLSRGMFMLQDSFTDILNLPDVYTEALDLNNGTATFDFALSIEDKGETLLGTLEYKTGLFQEGHISQLQQNFQTILDHITANPDQPLVDLPDFREIVNQPALDSNGQQTLIQKSRGTEEYRRFMSPQDALELKLVQTWEKVFGLKIASVRDNFFELGGHSLLAVKLFAEIEKAFNQKLPLAALFEAQTVEAMANLLRQEGWSSPWESLVPIQIGGHLTPIFFVPPLGGITIRITNLVKHLGADVPFYGLQAYGLEEGQQPQDRLEDIAAHYLKEIKTVQPAGPYQLGGQCFGGSIAFEMAQQLQAEGQTVTLLFVLDARPPTITGPSDRTFGDMLADLLAARRPRTIYRQTRKTLRYIQKQSERTLRRLFPTHKITFWRSPQQRRHQRVIHAHDWARYTYRAKPYPGRIITFDATDRPARIAKRLEQEWASLALDGIETCPVPGSHRTILEEPNIQVLAKQLNRYLLTDIESA